MTGRTVWLASYPKSGNTWFRAVYSALRTDGAPDLGALGTIASSRERFDDALSIPSSDLTRDEIEYLRPRADDVVDEEFDHLHLQKIHDQLSSGPASRYIVSVAATHCAIYLIRDPRDVAVSLAHHNESGVDWAAVKVNDPGTAISNRTDDISDQLLQRVGSWSVHVRSWVDNAPFPVHPVRYEDCLADPIAVFGAAFSAAGFDIETDKLIDAVKQSSFAALREREGAEGFREARSRSAPFFRQGTAGGWREQLSQGLADDIAAAHAEVMARFGYLDP
jgi:aryl sulfotransferase